VRGVWLCLVNQPQLRHWLEAGCGGEGEEMITLRQLFRDLFLATAAFFNKGKSGRVSDRWRETELWRYEDKDLKEAGLK
jgi:hypothetical protein